MKRRNRSLVLYCLILSVPVLCLFCGSLLYFIGRPASYVWVMDAGEYKNEFYLVKMCPTGTRLSQTQFGQSGEIDIDPEKQIVWAAEMGDADDIHYQQVVQVDRDGELLDRFQGYSGSLIAVDASDRSVWLTTWNPLEQVAGIAHIASNGKLIRKIGGMDMPYSMVLDPRDHSLWIADGGNRSLAHFSVEGEKLFEMRIPGYFFSNAPDQVAIDPDTGNLWFTTAGPGMVHKISSSGELLFEMGGLGSPIAVTIDSFHGNIWVADYDLGGAGSLLKLDAQENILLIQALPAHASAAAINPFDGTLWVGVDGEMIRFMDDGRMAGGSAGFHQPHSIAFMESGNDLRSEVKCALAFYLDMLK